MAASSRFLEPDAIHRRVPGCPLAVRPPSTDERACSTCPYNLLYPTAPHVGCTTSTPTDVFDRARAALTSREPGLAAELEALRRAPDPITADSPIAARWLELGERWFAGLGAHDDDEREVASVAARFARAAMQLGEPVEILR